MGVGVRLREQADNECNIGCTGLAGQADLSVLGFFLSRGLCMGCRLSGFCIRGQIFIDKRGDFVLEDVEVYGFFEEIGYGEPARRL